MKIGFCRLDITPPLGVHLDGHYEVRPCAGVLDPVYVNVMAVADEENTAVIVSCDQCHIEGPAGILWPEEIADRLGLSRSAILFCCTHTHTGPIVDGVRDPSDPMYDAWLRRRVVDAARMAVDDLKPVVSMEGGERSFPGVGYIRRFLMKDGSANRFRPQIADQFVGFASEADNSIRVVRILRENAPSLTLVNCQIHPDNIGGYLVSADWPGELRRTLEQHFPDSRTIFYQGAEGDMIATDLREPVTPKTYEKAMAFGRKVAACALEVCRDLKPLEPGKVGFLRETVYCRTKRTPESVRRSEEILRLYDSGEAEKLSPLPWEQWYLCVEALQIRELEQMRQDTIRANVSALRFGDVGFIGFPGELFSALGMEVRKASPFPMTILSSLTNGSVGYLATEKAYDQGGYEPRGSKLAKGGPELLVETAKKLLNQLSRETEKTE